MTAPPVFLSRVVLPPSLRQRVAIYETELRTGSIRALTRPLRDERSDRKVRRLFAAGQALDDTDIDRLVTFYMRSLAGYTEDLERDLYRRQTAQFRLLGQWEEKLQDRPEDRPLTIKVWHTRGDHKVREDHRVMDGTGVLFDALFATPDGGFQVAPPYTYNCRCWASVHVLDRVRFNEDGTVRVPTKLQ
jgi:hypothetical protein